MCWAPAFRPGSGFSAVTGSPPRLAAFPKQLCVCLWSDRCVVAEPCLCGTPVCRSLWLAQWWVPGWEPSPSLWTGTDRGRCVFCSSAVLFAVKLFKQVILPHLKGGGGGRSGWSSVCELPPPPRVWLSGVHGVVWQQVWGSLPGTQQLPGSHMEVCVVLHGWSRPAPPRQPCWRTLSPVWVSSVRRAQCELAPGPQCYPLTLHLQPAGRRGAPSSAGSSWRCRSSSRC